MKIILKANSKTQSGFQGVHLIITLLLLSFPTFFDYNSWYILHFSGYFRREFPTIGTFDYFKNANVDNKHIDRIDWLKINVIFLKQFKPC